jgi:hypothetical protein
MQCKERTHKNEIALTPATEGGGGGRIKNLPQVVFELEWVLHYCGQMDGKKNQRNQC